MGFLDSFAKKAINKVVESVVDQTIGGVLGNNTNQPQPQSPQQTEIRITKPDLSGTVVQDTILSRNECKEYNFRYEKSDKMYLSSSGALEIPIYYIIADSEDEAYEDSLCTNLPEIYIGDDEIGESDGRMMKGATNIVVTDIVEHGYIRKKYEFDNNISFSDKTSHFISYKFFVDKDDEANGISTVITLSIPSTCSWDMKLYAIQSLNLLAYTMSVE